MTRQILLLLVLFVQPTGLMAADPGQILPGDVSYDDQIPTPKQHLGFLVGQRHAQHHELVGYCRQLASVSDRVTIREYARSHGQRPLIMLFITSPENHLRLESIREHHLRLADPAASADVDIASLPAVINMGYGVHGNEPSASNTSLLVAYHLAAAEGEEHQRLLNDTVILLDPCLNPDGFERFANWANNHRGRTLNPDPNHREHHEGWPGGRTNYYWFDLNRDWLPVQHPESRGRLALYHRWKPNVVLDFHEMQTNSTYFFQPGIPPRNHPLTPQRTFELTRKFASFHAAALDHVGALYYTEESFDDFYMGKGSTYPDLHGSIGILFEQASARGHLQNTVHGPLSFAFAIRNQFLTSLSSLRATHELRLELLNHKRTFYQDAAALVRAGTTQGYVVAAPGDPVRLHRFLETLDAHQIRAHRLARDLQVDGQLFLAEQAFVIPANQPEFRYLQALFERRTRFKENIFYDVSAWTLPLAFNLQSAVLTESPTAEQMGEPFRTEDFPVRELHIRDDDLGYVIDWQGYYAPKTLYRLLAADVKVKVATAPLGIELDGHVRRFDRGTLLVPLGLQADKRREIVEILRQASADGVEVFSAATGLTPVGIDFGSNDLLVIPAPKVLLVTGNGVSGYESGEVWHLLDQRFQIPLTLVEARRLLQIRLEEYTAVVMVSGDYSVISPASVDRLKQYVAQGGTLVGIGAAIRWFDGSEIVKVDFREPSAESTTDGLAPSQQRRAYAAAEHDAALRLVRGSIFQTHVDHTHPVGYGFRASEPLPVFRNNSVILNPSLNVYSTPVVYDEEPRLSGYVSDENLARLAGSASVVVSGKGRGRVILMADNPNFRGFWYGTNRLFLNAMFFGPITRVPSR